MKYILIGLLLIGCASKPCPKVKYIDNTVFTPLYYEGIELGCFSALWKYHSLGIQKVDPSFCQELINSMKDLDDKESK